MYPNESILNFGQGIYLFEYPSLRLITSDCHSISKAEPLQRLHRATDKPTIAANMSKFENLVARHCSITAKPACPSSSELAEKHTDAREQANRAKNDSAREPPIQGGAEQQRRHQGA